MYLHYFVFSLENIDVVKTMCCVSWFVLITFIINEVFYIDRTTNLSPWSCNVAMVALIVKKKQTQFDYSSLGIFEHRFQGDKQKSVEAIIHQKE